MTSPSPAKRFNWGNLRMRVVSATVLVPTVVAAVWLGGYWFLALALVCTALLAREWGKISAPKAPRAVGAVVGNDVAGADPGALQHASKAVAAREGGDELDRWPFGRGAQRHHRGGCAHVPAAVGAEAQRHDHLAAEFVAHFAVDPRRRRRLERGETGPKGEAEGAEAEKGA